jgi:hypothetical protein
MRPLKILTWHVHGSYLYYLTQSRHTFYVPTRPGRPEGFGGRGGNFDWPANLVEVPAEQVRDLAVDVVLYQSTHNYLVDQHEILSEAQRELPRIYLEHNTPKPSPTDSRHPVDDPRVLLVHCTYFNQLMWDSGQTPTMVVPHGVVVPHDVAWTGELARGIAAINGLARRGRLAGSDLFQRLSVEVPLDLAGMGSEETGSLGDLPLRDLQLREASYRFFLSPIRYTSLPLALIEAMAIGLPIVALATTEVPRAVRDGVDGFVSNDPDELLDGMRRLLGDIGLARRMSQSARERARTQFGIERFQRDWDQAFARALGES